MTDPSGPSAPAVLAGLTLEEKAALLSGGGTWETAAIDRAAIPPIVLTDGPHGLRRHDPEAAGFSFEESLPATCFPTAAALGSSWDVDLLEEVGRALGEESRAAGVAVLLGPGMNIKRSPLCGRNFEYLSEDPVVSGRLGAALVRGVQGTGVGASLKHFAANNQETDRMTVSAEVDERTLREIYLAGFERAVRDAGPWTVMAAYNRINGVHAAQDPWLLTRVLREEWGFDGLVVSDWGAVLDPVAAVAAGLDLEMPATNGVSAARLAEAVREGRLEESALDRAVLRLLKLIERTSPGTGPRTGPGTGPAEADFDRDHALARRAAAESAVLLKNEDAILPLDPRADLRVAVIGEFARTPRYQGAGSSRVKPTRIDAALDALTGAAGPALRLAFAAGFTLSGEEAPELLAEAVAAARDADIAVVFLGLPEGEESEGFDRAGIDLPEVQVRLLKEIALVNPRTVVVLANGGVVRTSGWERHARAVLECWLNGQAGGGAVADLLFGRVNPSGRLAETIPLRLEDNPSHLNFPGSEGTVVYGERLYVGYRYYDAKGIDVAYPFGHGLSYTDFAYSGLSAVVEGDGDETVVRLRLDLTNTGTVAGKEVVQVYVRDVACSVDRPVRELKAFAKVALGPGESAAVRFELDARDLSYYSTGLGRWVLEPGDFEIGVGASSRDLRLAATVTVDAPPPVRPLTLDSTLAEWLAHPEGGPLLRRTMTAGHASAMSDPAILRMVESTPLNRLITLSGGALASPELEDYLAR
ncbi:glycoside hydrolase family 3 C-terminal domain-containing protein [Actinomadura rugatobispora]|uniref:Glycoside hydrolase family 3 C-terminal domain-containing protein n=1 Tax=Actinomadura rugatobispora TaxID=1994 RepID=A0ABW1A9P1_9ACTN|nr:glycoside hydrolase family 3 C-terminal domain-containing protein [Actinomadura rugatobispora]